MGLFLSDDAHEDTMQQTGFGRYKRLLSENFGGWFKINLLTIAGAIPLAAGIAFSILSSSLLLLVPCSLLGGAVFGPFLSGVYDAVLRRLRGDPMPWWDNYKRSWKQNFRCSLLSGAVLGLFLGVYFFMGMLMWWASAAPSLGTIAVYLFSGLIVLVILPLYWSQMVLFEQTWLLRMRNILLFSAKYFWRVFGVAFLQMVYWVFYILLAPWSVLLIPVLGFWYIVFLSLHLLYDPLNEELEIEERFKHRQGISE